MQPSIQSNSIQSLKSYAQFRHHKIKTKRRNYNAYYLIGKKWGWEKI